MSKTTSTYAGYQGAQEIAHLFPIAPTETESERLERVYGKKS